MISSASGQCRAPHQHVEESLLKGFNRAALKKINAV
jgi:hypothetical protein